MTPSATITRAQAGTVANSAETGPVFLDGDIIAFSGNGFLSDAIKIVSRNILTHMGCIIPREMLVDGHEQEEPYLFESTIEDGHSGPQLNPLRVRLAMYAKEGGRAYHFSYSPRIREFLNWQIMWDLATRKLHGDSYNVLELGAYVLRDLPFISYLPQLREANSHEEVCSELMAELLRAGGHAGLNPPLISPGIFASLRIYTGYEQLLGPPAAIHGFNTY